MNFVAKVLKRELMGNDTNASLKGDWTFEYVPGHQFYSQPRVSINERAKDPTAKHGFPWPSKLRK